MTDNEIALSFEAMLPTVRGKIRSLLNSRTILDCDMSGGIVMGNRVIPEYYGLEVVIAVAFQFNGYKAEIFRNYILRKASQHTQPIYINVDKIQGYILN